jgi:Ca2+-transporting ATPase
MRRKPRDPKSRILTARMLVVAMMQGGFIAATVFLVVWFARTEGYSDAHQRAFSFATLIVANLGLIAVNRSWNLTMWQEVRQPNPAFWWLLGGSAALLAIVLEAPPMRALFSFERLTFKEIGWCSIAGLASVAWFELLKWVGPRRYAPLGEDA